MKCIGIITKGGKKGGTINCDGNLQTIRTLANERSVKRERRCLKCNAQYWTIEQFEEDLKKNKKEQDIKYDELESNYHEVLNNANLIRQALKTFKGLLERA